MVKKVSCATCIHGRSQIVDSAVSGVPKAAVSICGHRSTDLDNRYIISQVGKYNGRLSVVWYDIKEMLYDLPEDLLRHEEIV